MIPILYDSLQYTYGLQRISEDQIIGSAWMPSFYGYDGAGTVRQLTNIAGAVTDTYEYDAWGNKVSSTGTTPNNYLYRAEQYDADLGLYYLRARYYDPLTGRFMSRDPESGKTNDPASLHRYLYAGDDPVNRIDPTGRADEEEEVGIIPNIIRATKAVATNLWGTLPEYLATVQRFIGIAYLTVQDVLEAIAANRYVASAARLLACGITGTMVARLATENNLSAKDRHTVIDAYLGACSAISILPWENPPPLDPPDDFGDFD